VNLALIAVNIVVFVAELTLSPRELRGFMAVYGLVPAHFSWIAAFTAMFVHAGWLHLIGNLLSLWIFGDNVEDRMGHGRYLAFYLLTGLVANLAQTWARPDSPLPLVGASGAIAGVMGAYIVLFPRSRVLVLLPLIIYVDIIEIPAIFFLGFWFLLQLLGGVGSLTEEGTMGGVAFWAHAAGFLSGIVGVLLFRRPERQRVEWWHD
jgi:membrane associated rhomboid family serine protease